MDEQKFKKSTINLIDVEPATLVKMISERDQTIKSLQQQVDAECNAKECWMRQCEVYREILKTIRKALGD